MPLPKPLPWRRELIGKGFCPPLCGRGMRLPVPQVIRLMRLCLVHGTVQKIPLLQSLGQLPKTPYTTSTGVRSFFPLHVEL